MKPIAKVECPDCGWFMIKVPEQISLFTLDVTGEGIIYQATTICPSCLRPLIDDIPKDIVDQYCERGVKLFSWFTGEEEKVKV